MENVTTAASIGTENGCEIVIMGHIKTVRGSSANNEAEAITKACKDAGRFLVGDILDDVVSNINKIQIQVKGISYEDFEKLALDLIKIRGVLNRYVRSFDERGCSTIDIETTEHSWQILQRLKSITGFDLTVETLSRNKIVLKRKKI